MNQDTINTLVTTGAIAAIALSPWGDPQIKGIAIAGLSGLAPGALGLRAGTPRRRLDPLLPPVPGVEGGSPERSGDM
jgi:hypothetical protein